MYLYVICRSSIEPKKMWYFLYPNCPNNCPPPPSAKNISLFSRREGAIIGIFMNFHFFDSRPFQMSSSELKLYFITYYRPLVYFEGFSIYLSVFHESMWSPKKSKKNFLGIFESFFFLVFARGGNYSDNSGTCTDFLFCLTKWKKLKSNTKQIGHGNRIRNIPPLKY